ncbi:MAG: Coq4 family protein, partial [bacterium]|nr:Coq4 family protein [bacterium]
MRALKAVRRLIADKEDTVQVFEIMRALAGKAIPKGYRRLLSTPEGGRIAYERDEFAARLSDPVWLASFGPGTVGAAYRDFIAPRGLSAEGLAEESRKIAENDVDAPHPLAWYGRRLRDVHDVWHVLTGYNTDALGEVCV